MSRLVVVSNRVPLPSERGAARRRPRGCAGRRAATRLAVVRLERPAQRRRRSADGAYPAGRRHHLRHDRSDRSRNIAPSTCNFANGALWPLLHFRLGLLDFHREDYDGYRRGQPPFRRGAEAAAAARRPDLGARLPPDSRWPTRCARWASATASASSCTRRSCRRRCCTPCRARTSCCARCAPTTWSASIPAPTARPSWTASARSSACAPTRTAASSIAAGRCTPWSIRSASMPTAFADGAAQRRAQHRGAAVAREPAGRPRAGDRRRPAGLFQGPAQPFRGDRAAADAATRSTGGRSASCRSPRARARMSATTSGCGATSTASSATSTAGTPNSTGCRCAT